MVDSGIRTLFLRCTDGCFADKLEPTFVAIGAGFEPTSSESNSEMLTIAPPDIQAVRKGIEPIATDRQSVMLAITPTNLVIRTGLEPIFQE